MGIIRVAVFNEYGGGDIYVVDEDQYETKEQDRDWVEKNGQLVGSFDDSIV